MPTALFQRPTDEEAIQILEAFPYHLSKAEAGQARATDPVIREDWRLYHQYLFEQVLLARTVVRDVSRSLIEAGK